MALQTDDTIAACATATGVGAIAVLRLAGPQAIGICNSVFHGKDLEAQAANTVHFGTIRDLPAGQAGGGTIVDEVLVTLFRAPHSYTGEDVVEISCHGSGFIVQQLLDLFIKQGARAAGPGEFTLRAFINGKLDLSQAEAVADLIASNSASSHRVAMQQMRGGFSAEIAKLREQLLNFASLIELELDFSEEDVEFANRDQLEDLIQRIRVVTTALIESFRVGNVIKNGVPVVIAGKPNAGKSTLLNALLKEERAIVSEIEGTTRDTIEEEITINGSVFRFIDTAGIRDTADTIEAIGVGKTLEKIRSSAIVAYLFDVHDMTSRELKQIVEQLQAEMQEGNSHLLLIGNKIDLENKAAIEQEFAAFENALFISARDGDNLDAFTTALSNLMDLGTITADDTVITNARHLEALTKADESLQNVTVGMQSGLSGDLLAMDIRQALYYLGEITGEVTNDELLGNIFGKFCIGK